MTNDELRANDNAISLQAAYESGRASRDAEVEALKRDAERWRWCVNHAAWHRDDGRTFMAVEVATQANLSSIGARKDAIDAAMSKESGE